MNLHLRYRRTDLMPFKRSKACCASVRKRCRNDSFPFPLLFRHYFRCCGHWRRSWPRVGLSWCLSSCAAAARAAPPNAGGGSSMSSATPSSTARTASGQTGSPTRGGAHKEIECVFRDSLLHSACLPIIVYQLRNLTPFQTGNCATALRPRLRASREDVPASVVGLSVEQAGPHPLRRRWRWRK